MKPMSDQKKQRQHGADMYDLIRAAADGAENDGAISLEDRNLLVAWADRSQRVRDALAEDRNLRSERLRRAAVLVQEVAESCDTSMHECASCKLNKNNNWDDQKLFNELDAIVKKLERHAASQLNERKD